MWSLSGTDESAKACSLSGGHPSLDLTDSAASLTVTGVKNRPADLICSRKETSVEKASHATSRRSVRRRLRVSPLFVREAGYGALREDGVCRVHEVVK
jgi:hypothetical protein